MGAEARHAVIFGATSMIGRHLLRRLSEQGATGQCLSRRSSPVPQETPQGFSWRILPAKGALSAPADADLLSLAPIAALPPLLARTTGGRRLVALSTTGVTYKAQSPDPAERAEAEAVRRAEEEIGRLCRERGIAWTILRPTLIYDPGLDLNVSAIADAARRFGFVPVAWPATGRRQPIHADDVAHAMVAALDAPGAVGRILDIPGGETLTYRDMVRRIFRALGRRPVSALPAARARPARLSRVAQADGRGLQHGEPGADEHGPDLRSRAGARHPGDRRPPVPARVLRRVSARTRLPSRAGARADANRDEGKISALGCPWQPSGTATDADLHRRDSAPPAGRQGRLVRPDSEGHARLRHRRRGADGPGLRLSDRHRPRVARDHGPDSHREPHPRPDPGEDRGAGAGDGYADLDQGALRRGRARDPRAGASRASSRAASSCSARPA